MKANPRFLVGLSFLLGFGMAADRIKPRFSMFSIFMAMSGFQAAWIVGTATMTYWVAAEAGVKYRVRQKIWWALLFVSNFWGLDIALWSRRGASDYLLLSCGGIAILHIVLSVLAWRDNPDISLLPA